MEFIPARVKVIEHIRCKYACRACEEGVKIAPPSVSPIHKSIATCGLLSHVIVSKYADHLPLYRQEQMLQRMGIDIARSTLCSWILSCSELLEPLYNLLKEEIVAENHIQADETPVQVMQEKKKENTAKSYVWVYLGGSYSKKCVLFEYSPTRSGKNPEEFLQRFKGILQTDGYAGYSALHDTESLLQLRAWRMFVGNFLIL